MASDLATVNIKIDRNLKEATESRLKSMGLNATTAITMFYTAVSRQNRIPFEITGDPFYSEQNIRRLEDAVSSVQNGQSKLKEHELIEA